MCMFVGRLSDAKKYYIENAFFNTGRSSIYQNLAVNLKKSCQER